MTDRDAVLRELLRVPVETTRGTMIVETKLPTAGRLHPLVLADPNPREDERRLMLGILINRVVTTFDGKPMTREWSRALAGDPVLRGVASRGIGLALAGVRAEGLARFRCPHCQAWDAELSLGSLATRLGAEPGEIILDDLLAWPTLAQIWPAPNRPFEVPTSSRVTAMLPSSLLGAGDARSYELVSLATPEGREREERGWERWTAEPADESKAWDPEAPGFRGVLRLSTALLDPAGPNAIISPAIIEALPAPDWLFLDCLYHLAYHVAIEDPEAAVVQCARCKGRFLPAR